MIDPNESDVEKLFAELGMERSDYSEPSLLQKLEGMRGAVELVKIADRGSLRDLFVYWSGLDDYEQGCVIGALAQLSVVGVHVMAHMGGREFGEQLGVMEAELGTVLKDGGTP